MLINRALCGSAPAAGKRGHSKEQCLLRASYSEGVELADKNGIYLAILGHLRCFALKG